MCNGRASSLEPIEAAPLCCSPPAQEEQWGERLLCDGLHFTAAGQDRVWALMKQLLDDTWPDIRYGMGPYGRGWRSCNGTKV